LSIQKSKFEVKKSERIISNVKGRRGRKQRKINKRRKEGRKEGRKIKTYPIFLR
jgi:hypothetical protein